MLFLAHQLGHKVSDGTAPAIGASVSGGRMRNHRHVTIYCLIPAVLLILEALSRGRYN